MGWLDGKWFSALAVILFGALIFLRIQFPAASKRAEATVLGIAAALFFTLGEALLHR